MKGERRLEDVTMAQELWSEATTEMFREDWEMRDQVEHYGAAFRAESQSGALSNSQLKDMVKKANRLEREVIEKSDGNIEALGDADYIEAVSRRLAHHALKYAYSGYYYHLIRG